MTAWDQDRRKGVRRRSDIAETSAEVAAAIDTLRHLLLVEYGQDFSYKICGGGRVLAVSNSSHGHQPPQIRKDGKK